MGVWGYGPFDNDDAADMVVALAVKITKVVEATDAYDAYREARAAVQLVSVAHGTDVLGGFSLLNSLKALARMRSDTQWLASVKQPKILARQIENELTALRTRMQACRDCRRSNNKKELNRIVAEACAVKVPKSAISQKKKPYPPGDSRLRRSKIPKKPRK